MVIGTHEYVTQLMRNIIINKCLMNYVKISSNFNESTVFNLCSKICVSFIGDGKSTKLLPALNTKEFTTSEKFILILLSLLTFDA